MTNIGQIEVIENKIKELQAEVEKLKLADNFSIDEWNEKLQQLGLPSTWVLGKNRISLVGNMANADMFIRFGNLQKQIYSVAYISIGYAGHHLNIELQHDVTLDDLWQKVKRLKEL